MAKKYFSNYAVATKWLNNSYVLCNNISDVDVSVHDNLRFPLYVEDEEGNEMLTDIYQWFISDCSESDVEYLEKTFGLLFSYSDLLDCYVLCVPHYGTAWDYVTVETTNEHAVRKLGESK